MGMNSHDYRREVLQPAAGAGMIYGLGSAVDLNFAPGGPVDVMRVGVISDTTGFVATGTSLFQVRFDLYAKSSGATAGYTVTTGVAMVSTAASSDLGNPGNGIYVNLSAAPLELKAGEKLVAVVTAGGAASAASSGTVFVEFRDMPWQELGAPTSAPGDGSGAGRIVNMVKK